MERLLHAEGVALDCSSHQNKSALECLKGLLMSAQPAPALPQTVYVVFSGQIDQTSVQPSSTPLRT